MIEAAERGHVELTQLLSKVLNHTPKIVFLLYIDIRQLVACKSQNITVANKMFKQCIKLSPYCKMAQLNTGLPESVISDRYSVI